MIIFQVINKLYTTNNLKWLEDVENTDAYPFIINKWLSMNEGIQKQVRYLDKFVFSLQPKQFLMLVWSVIPKQDKAPYCKYIKTSTEIEEEYNFLIIKIRKYLEISDHDWEHCKNYFLKDIEKNKIEYFKNFGIDKKIWKKFGLDFKEMKKEDKKVNTNNNLNKWF